MEENEINKPTGMKAFMIIWFGRLISIFGSMMTGFVLMIWIWTTTGEATPFAIFGFAYFAPLLIATPLAGVYVDRWNRKFSMMLGDLGAGGATVIVYLLVITGNLEVWHLYITGVVSGFFGAFQFPAFSASITLMVSKENYARASGLMSLADTSSGLIAPVLAATILAIGGIQTVLLIDIFTFSAAVGTLFIVRIPEPVKEKVKGSLKDIFKETTYGFKYILKRRSLLGLLTVFLVINIFFTIGNTVRTPMILARTGNNSYALASVQTAAALGGVVGGSLLALWGGPKKRIRGIFVCMLFSSLIGGVMMGIGRSVLIWGIGSFAVSFLMVILGGCSQSFWQSKVAPEIQGKVFATRRLLAQLAIPVASLVAGPMADKVFEPMMNGSSSTGTTFGLLVGNGVGSGMALMYLLTGLFGTVIALVGYNIKHIREAEDILPDNDVKSDAVTTASC